MKIPTEPQPVSVPKPEPPTHTAAELLNLALECARMSHLYPESGCRWSVGFWYEDPLSEAGERRFYPVLALDEAEMERTIAEEAERELRELERENTALRAAFAPLAAQIQTAVHAGAGHGDETVASLLLKLGEVRRMWEAWEKEP